MHDVFGDVNLGAAMLVLLLVQIIGYMMKPQCSC